FMACRPWGKVGDRKNDGFLKSERRLFQVYAPNEMEAAKAVAKITEDFEGAKEHWGKHFDKWSFVHNASDGLPPHVQKLLLNFENANPGIKLDPWCVEELRLVFRGLSVEDKQSWFGLAPTEETKAKLGFKDLQIVLETISSNPTSELGAVKSVPTGKIEANALSESVATLLKAGMIKAVLVQNFFEQWHDQTLGERLAQTFKDKYVTLREQFTPNNIFAELQSWAGGNQRGTPEHELAVLTVIAYYFERCDIFEEPRSGSS
ncbi:MAG: ABC-three component system protein, partial [Candidatus Sulfotelmatobacter sp.]